MKNKPIFNWDKDIGMASCILQNGNKTFVGIAQCHPDDMDMMSEKTGCEIAFTRARIKIFQARRDEIKTRLSALNDFYHMINHSKYYVETAYENKMLKKYMDSLQADLELTKQLIEDERKHLTEYIDLKENFYKRIRSNRKQE